MTADHQAHRGSGLDLMHRHRAADTVVAEALMYAGGGRRLTVEHGEPLNKQAAALVQQLVDDVELATACAGYYGGAAAMRRRLPVRLWDHQNLAQAAQEVADAVLSRRRGSP